jgi:hypothetical protein
MGYVPQFNANKAKNKPYTLADAERMERNAIYCHEKAEDIAEDAGVNGFESKEDELKTLRRYRMLKHVADWNEREAARLRRNLGGKH